jgi:hypothetical protein
MWLEFIVRQARQPIPDKDKKVQLKICCPIDFLPTEPQPNSIPSAQLLPVKPAILPMRCWLLPFIILLVKSVNLFYLF